MSCFTAGSSIAVDLSLNNSQRRQLFLSFSVAVLVPIKDFKVQLLLWLFCLRSPALFLFLSVGSCLSRRNFAIALLCPILTLKT